MIHATKISGNELWTVGDIEREADRQGSFFFKPDTLRFWKSRIGSAYPVKGANGSAAYFTTSEAFPRHGMDGKPQGRTYAVRLARYKRGKLRIDTIERFPSASAARRAAERFAKNRRA